MPYACAGCGHTFEPSGSTVGLYCPDCRPPDFGANQLPPELATQILEREELLKKFPMSEDVRELLTILAEECGEVVQRCTKVLRFGFTKNPWNGKRNKDELELELGDVLAIVRALAALGAIELHHLDQYADVKLAKMRVPDGRLRHAKIPEGA